MTPQHLEHAGRRHGWIGDIWRVRPTKGPVGKALTLKDPLDFSAGCPAGAECQSPGVHVWGWGVWALPVKLSLVQTQQIL